MAGQGGRPELEAEGQADAPLPNPGLSLLCPPPSPPQPRARRMCPPHKATTGRTAWRLDRELQPTYGPLHLEVWEGRFEALSHQSPRSVLLGGGAPSSPSFWGPSWSRCNQDTPCEGRLLGRGSGGRPQSHKRLCRVCPPERALVSKDSSGGTSVQVRARSCVCVCFSVKPGLAEDCRGGGGRTELRRDPQESDLTGPDAGGPRVQRIRDPRVQS